MFSLSIEKIASTPENYSDFVAPRGSTGDRARQSLQRSRSQPGRAQLSPEFTENHSNKVGHNESKSGTTLNHQGRCRRRSAAPRSHHSWKRTTDCRHQPTHTFHTISTKQSHQPGMHCTFLHCPFFSDCQCTRNDELSQTGSRLSEVLRPKTEPPPGRTENTNTNICQKKSNSIEDCSCVLLRFPWKPARTRGTLRMLIVSSMEHMYLLPSQGSSTVLVTVRERKQPYPNSFSSSNRSFTRTRGKVHILPPFSIEKRKKLGSRLKRGRRSRLTP